MHRHALVVTVWRSIAPAMPASLIAMPAGLAREAQAALDAGYEAEATDLADKGVELAHERGLDAEPVTVASASAVWLTIIDTADEHDAAAVVVGSRGRSTMRSAFLGSVSNGLVHHCRRPVVVVPPATIDDEGGPEG